MGISIEQYRCSVGSFCSTGRMNTGYKRGSSTSTSADSPFLQYMQHVHRGLPGLPLTLYICLFAYYSRSIIMLGNDIESNPGPKDDESGQQVRDSLFVCMNYPLSKSCTLPRGQSFQGGLGFLPLQQTFLFNTLRKQTFFFSAKAVNKLFFQKRPCSALVIK